MKTLISFVLSLCFIFPSFAKVPQTDPYAMIEQVADETFKRFSNEYEQIKQNPELLKDIIRDEMLPYIDYRYAAYKVIGSQLKKTTREQRDAFVPIFRDYLITTYAQVFTLYDGQTIEFQPAQSFEGKKIVTVRTVVVDKARPPIKIDFKVRLNKKTKEWRAFDMVAEGISLLDSKQKELSSIIRQKGIDEVANMLKEKSLEKVEFPETDKS